MPLWIESEALRGARLGPISSFLTMASFPGQELVKNTDCSARQASCFMGPESGPGFCIISKHLGWSGSAAHPQAFGALQSLFKLTPKAHTPSSLHCAQPRPFLFRLPFLQKSENTWFPGQPHPSSQLALRPPSN